MNEQMFTVSDFCGWGKSKHISIKTQCGKSILVAFSFVLHLPVKVFLLSSFAFITSPQLYLLTPLFNSTCLWSHRGARSRGRGRSGTAQSWLSWSLNPSLSTSARAGAARSSSGVARCERPWMFWYRGVVEPRCSANNLPALLSLLQQHPSSQKEWWNRGNSAGQNWSMLTGDC